MRPRVSVWRRMERSDRPRDLASTATNTSSMRRCGKARWWTASLMLDGKSGPMSVRMLHVFTGASVSTTAGLEDAAGACANLATELQVAHFGGPGGSVGGGAEPGLGRGDLTQRPSRGSKPVCKCRHSRYMVRI